MFQSTRPVRGATVGVTTSVCVGCFNPRAPCGARPVGMMPPSSSISFQSTRPVRGATGDERKPTDKQMFQSTRPVRGATRSGTATRTNHKVSIHAPRAGRDRDVGGLTGVDISFNPRAPCGARQLLCKMEHNLHHVSIHAPRAGRDGLTLSALTMMLLFQSTRPVRGATFWTDRLDIKTYCFNPRAPCGARPSPTDLIASRESFNPRAPCGARPLYLLNPSRTERFQSTRPVRGATAKEVTISLFCHIFMGVTRHEYDFLGAHAPRPSFSVIHVPTFLHLIFCSLHLRTLPSAHMMIAASMS